MKIKFFVAYMGKTAVTTFVARKNKKNTEFYIYLYI